MRRNEVEICLFVLLNYSIFLTARMTLHVLTLEQILINIVSIKFAYVLLFQSSLQLLSTSMHSPTFVNCLLIIICRLQVQVRSEGKSNNKDMSKILPPKFRLQERKCLLAIGNILITTNSQNKIRELVQQYSYFNLCKMMSFFKYDNK